MSAPGSTGARASRFGGSRYGRTLQRSMEIEKELGLDRRSIPYDELEDALAVPEFEEGRRYSQRQLTLMAEKMLADQARDEKPVGEHPAILLYPQYKARLRREIYVGSGIPDPSVASGMYWRTHPDGRSFRVERHSAESFYRG